MGRERRVDGPSTARPPHRFELDLTSVCVRSGAVQLPYRLQGAFVAGPVAAVDADGGASLDLQFRPPRALMGLRAFFEAHELRPNDRLALVFTEEGLRVEAIRRERKAPPAGARSHAGLAPSESAPPRGTAGEPRAGGRGGRRGAAPAAPPDPVREDAPRSAASSAPPSLRMAPPPPSVPAESPTAESPTAKMPEQASRPAPRWEPLDVLAHRPASEEAPAEAPTQDAAPARLEASAPRVREIRRGSPLRSQGSRPPGREEAREEGAVNGVEADTLRSEQPARPGGAERGDAERPPKPFHGRGLDLFGLRRRLGFGRGQGAPTDDDVGDDAGEGAGDTSRTVPRDDAAARLPGTARDGADAARRAAASATRPSTAVGVADVEARAEVPTPGASVVHEEDVGAVEAYLARPDVPAIVRAERVAEELGLPVARAEGVLDRISENSERLSRIRAGAYMLRRRGEG